MPPAAVAPKPTVLCLAADLAAGRTTSRALIEAALARIADPAGEGARTFTKVYQRHRARRGRRAGPPARMPAMSPRRSPDCRCRSRICSMSPGEPTLAGSKALDDRPPARHDAPIVARLRAAGAVLIGRTNMTEFAFSGVGINPHYGTPGNPHDRSCIPGGSSSGAAVSVADGAAVVAIGTDTGGSVRIPAALCGIVGFKPTHRAFHAPARRRCRRPSIRSGRWPTASPAARSPTRLWPARRRSRRCRPGRGAAARACRKASSSTASRRRWRAPFAAACATLSRCRRADGRSAAHRVQRVPGDQRQGRFRADRGLCLAPDAAGAARRRVRSAGAARGIERGARHDRGRVHRPWRPRRADLIASGRGAHRGFRRHAV